MVVIALIIHFISPSLNTGGLRFVQPPPSWQKMQPTQTVNTFMPLVSSLTAAPPKTVWEAASDGDVPALLAALSAHPGHLNQPDEGSGRYTPVVYACRGDHIGALRVLTDSGADLDRRGHEGVTAVFAAAATGSMLCLHHLLAHRANVDVPFRGLRPLQWLLAPQRTSRRACESRLVGGRHAAAQALILANAIPASPALCHHPSRAMLSEWADRRLTLDQSYLTWLCGVHFGAARHGGQSPVALLNIGGLSMRILAFLPRHRPSQLARLVAARAVWTREEADEALFAGSWFEWGA